MPSTANRYQAYMNFAVETAFLAGRLTLGYFQAGVRPDFKPDDSPVTVADREAETLIRARIESAYPDHAILGEEYGASDGKASGHRWIIDPIDGTKSFIRGVPLYGVLIGLEIEGRCEVGVAYFPALNDMIHAATGLGCFWNGRPVRVSSTKDLSRAVVCFTDAGTFDTYQRTDQWRRVRAAAYQCAGWSDAYGYALVATGRAEVMLDPILNPYDCAPFPPILKEAGGYFGDWSGNETIYANEGLAVNANLHNEVLALLADA